MWLQQKMVTPVTSDPKQQAQSRMMLWMMPIMFAFITLQFPSGLALYWVASNIIGIVVQYYVTGMGGLSPAASVRPAGNDKKYLKRVYQSDDKLSSDIGADIVIKDEESDKKSGGLGHPPNLGKSRYQPGTDRICHPKKR